MKTLANTQQIDKDSLIRIILIVSTIICPLGFILNYVFSMITGEKSVFMPWDNLVSSIALISSYILYQKKVISLTTAFMTHIITVTLRSYFYLILKIISPHIIPEGWVYMAGCVLVVPVMAACLTKWKILPMLIVAISMVLYITAAMVSKSNDMIRSISTLFFVFVGVVFSFLAIMDLSKKIAKEKAEEVSKQIAMTHFFNLNPEQLGLIMGDKMTKEQATKIMEKAEMTAGYLFMDKVKEAMYSEESIKNAIRTHHPHLTAHDLQLCCYILNNMSVTDISHVRHVEVSSVTAHRSRLRTKLGLLPKNDLRDYLDRLVSE